MVNFYTARHILKIALFEELDSFCRWSCPIESTAVWGIPEQGWRNFWLAFCHMIQCHDQELDLVTYLQQIDMHGR